MMDHAVEELEKNVRELIKRYNKLREDNANLHKKLALLKSTIEESDARRAKIVNKLTKIIAEIEKYVSEEERAGITGGRGNE